MLETRKTELSYPRAGWRTNPSAEDGAAPSHPHTRLRRRHHLQAGNHVRLAQPGGEVLLSIGLAGGLGIAAGTYLAGRERKHHKALPQTSLSRHPCPRMRRRSHYEPSRYTRRTMNYPGSHLVRASPPIRSHLCKPSPSYTTEMDTRSPEPCRLCPKFTNASMPSATLQLHSLREHGSGLRHPCSIGHNQTKIRRSPS